MALDELEAEEITGVELQRRMRQRGISMRQLATEAGIAQPHISNALNAKEVLGEEARERFEKTLIRLGLDQAEPAPRAGVFRLHRREQTA
jgi:transcriptional regulator with XRE-family HTH domain